MPDCQTCEDKAYSAPCPDCEVMDVDGATQAERDAVWAEIRAEFAAAKAAATK